MLNHLKSVVYGFSLFPRLFSFVFVGKLAFLSAVFRTLADDFMLSHGLLLLLRDLNTPSMADGHVKW
ncbi:hypothetical protein [Vibrio vulnificus]|uniref:hypothetical protein n=1 Tax=Vibrio vulnificus TaxID=672 RepID=UPI001E2D41FD|nr:hypothetical protein [Vibrio vulnificus]